MATEQEVTPQTQALMALQLEQHVRELIRRELVSAFTDWNFSNTVGLTAHGFKSAMISQLQYDPQFRDAVRVAVRGILDKQ